MNEITKFIYENLQIKYQKSVITTQELANELGLSISIVEYYITKNINLPNYLKMAGVGKNGRGGRILFPLHEVAKYLSITK